jgi:hypothetical protein
VRGGGGGLERGRGGGAPVLTPGGGVTANRSGQVHLLATTARQHHAAVGQRHRLDLVVRDVDGGDVQTLVLGLDLAVHLHSPLGIEVGQGFVEQEHLGLAHHGAAKAAGHFKA